MHRRCQPFSPLEPAISATERPRTARRLPIRHTQMRDRQFIKRCRRDRRSGRRRLQLVGRKREFRRGDDAPVGEYGAALEHVGEWPNTPGHGAAVSTASVSAAKWSSGRPSACVAGAP